jgi:hypothetical protein
MPADKGWAREFDEAILLPDGRELRTLLDAGHYVQKLPRATLERPEWNVAMKTLLMAAEDGLPLMYARIALLRALNAAAPRPPPGPRKKATKKYRVIR